MRKVWERPNRSIGSHLSALSKSGSTGHEKLGCRDPDGEQTFLQQHHSDPHLSSGLVLPSPSKVTQYHQPRWLRYNRAIACPNQGHHHDSPRPMLQLPLQRRQLRALLPQESVLYCCKDLITLKTSKRRSTPLRICIRLRPRRLPRPIILMPGEAAKSMDHQKRWRQIRRWHQIRRNDHQGYSWSTQLERGVISIRTSESACSLQLTTSLLF